MTDKDAMRPKGRRHANTIRDVAIQAGVSISTVSKALSGGGRMRPETRDKVQQVAVELGFRPNSLAQSLHNNRSRTIGILSTDRFGRFTFPIVEAMEEVLADDGIGIFMCNATDDPARERQHLAQLLGKRVDGIVVTARRADSRPRIDLGGRAIPTIYVFSQSDDPDSLSLLPDDEGGAALATRHLLQLGRRNIAHVTGPENFEAVRLRRKGYANTLRAASLVPREEFYLSGSWSEAWGREAASRLLEMPAGPDAIFCGNDQIARGVCDTLREAGVSVPRDVAVIGYDNWEVMAESSRPRLTSVDMNLMALGREAGLALIDLMAGKRQSGVRRLPCSLVVRHSCGAETPETIKQEVAP
jgi:LacI family transcriptional regulator